jgi:glutamine amidotransferase
MVVIADFGSGNVGSISRMLERAGIEARSSDSAAGIDDAERLILPGVGAFDSVMSRFMASGLAESILRRHKAGVPILGICVGLQILTEGSEEGGLAGLGLIAGRTRNIRSIVSDPKARVPHMGWAPLVVHQTRPLFDPLPPKSKFYFVHSYAVVCGESRDCIASVVYDDGTRLTAAVQRDNLFGIQFHPEKSRNFGLALLRNFASFR